MDNMPKTVIVRELLQIALDSDNQADSLKKIYNLLLEDALYVKSAKKDINSVRLNHFLNEGYICSQMSLDLISYGLDEASQSKSAKLAIFKKLTKLAKYGFLIALRPLGCKESTIYVLGKNDQLFSEKVLNITRKSIKKDFPMFKFSELKEDKVSSRIVKKSLLKPKMASTTAVANTEPTVTKTVTAASKKDDFFESLTKDEKDIAKLSVEKSRNDPYLFGFISHFCTDCQGYITVNKINEYFLQMPNQFIQKAFNRLPLKDLIKFIVNNDINETVDEKVRYFFSLPIFD